MVRKIIEFCHYYRGQILWLIMCMLLSSTHAFNINPVVGSSMEPTYTNGNILFSSSVFMDLSHGDVITFNQEGKALIKRIVGIPGDRIEMIDKLLYVNDELVENDRDTSQWIFDGKQSIDTFDEIVLNDKEYYVLGDNRDASSDSRVFGPIKENDIYSKILFQ